MAKSSTKNFISGKDKISFEAEELGIPYIVKISYFPGWQVRVEMVLI